ncbi:hypothetical protein [Proteus columbae]|uniref:hypothetical protein n=1 Tax=Proteus columbae TaxID=1987580 RepID=UPI00288C3D14|nr:hypothetical protein [Proteus columbae]
MTNILAEPGVLIGCSPFRYFSPILPLGSIANSLYPLNIISQLGSSRITLIKSLTTLRTTGLTIDLCCSLVDSVTIGMVSPLLVNITVYTISLQY